MRREDLFDTQRNSIHGTKRRWKSIFSTEFLLAPSALRSVSTENAFPRYSATGTICKLASEAVPGIGSVSDASYTYCTCDKCCHCILWVLFMSALTEQAESCQAEYFPSPFVPCIYDLCVSGQMSPKIPVFMAYSGKLNLDFSGW